MAHSLTNSIDDHFGKTISDFKDSAVLVLIHKINNELHLFFNQRTDKVKHHKGQICFPGGVREAEDKTLWDTAVRETIEETGVRPEGINQLMELETTLTPTGYRIFPFVAFKEILGPLQPNHDEIQEAFSLPLENLTNDENLRFETREYMGQNFSIPFFEYENRTIWGATGRILLELKGQVPNLKTLIS